MIGPGLWEEDCRSNISLSSHHLKSTYYPHVLALLGLALITWRSVCQASPRYPSPTFYYTIWKGVTLTKSWGLGVRLHLLEGEVSTYIIEILLKRELFLLYIFITQSFISFTVNSWVYSLCFRL